jgi:hypothetical protein
VLTRIAACVALTAILACSGLGLCWQRFGSGGAHDCCAADETQIATPAKPCAASGEVVTVVKIAPALPVTSRIGTAEAVEFASASRAFAPPLFKTRSAPLVLRI